MQTNLKAVGQLLYGPEWQSPLARRMGVNPRTMRYWAAGDRDMSDQVRAHLIQLAANALAERSIDMMLEQDYPPDEIILTTYNSDEDLRKVTGEPWTADFQRDLMAELAKRLELAGHHKVSLTEIAAEPYLEWLDGRKNTAEMRAAYVNR